MEKETATLLVDNSNTRTKFALAAGGMQVRTMPTADLSRDSICALLHGWEYGGVCISSVVPQAGALLQQVFADKPVSRVRAELAPSLFAGYAGVETLGEDRVANVLAVADGVPLPAVAVDMGTAVTFDVVCAGPRFAGGIIAPGLRMMAASLHSRTAQLPAVEVGEVGEVHACRIGGNTEEAMQAGVRLAFCGMVRETLHAIARELGTRPYAVATGGNAAFAAACIPELDTVDEHLTLKGIALAAGLARQFFAKG